MNIGRNGPMQPSCSPCPEPGSAGETQNLPCPAGSGNPGPAGVGRPLLDTFVACRVMLDRIRNSIIWGVRGREGGGRRRERVSFLHSGLGKTVIGDSWSPANEKDDTRQMSLRSSFQFLSPSTGVCSADIPTPSLPQATFHHISRIHSNSQ